MMRKLTGVLMDNINKQSLLKRQMKKQLDGNERSSSLTKQRKLDFTNNECQKDRLDELFYQGVMKEFKKASNVVDFLKDYEKQAQTQDLDTIMLEDLNAEDMAAIRSGSQIIGPNVLLDSIKGKDKQIMNRKSQNLWKLFYGNTRVEEQNDLRYSWQDVDSREDKKLVNMKLRQNTYNTNMPQVIEENVDNQQQFSRSESSMQSMEALNRNDKEMIIQFGDKRQRSYIEKLN